MTINTGLVYIFTGDGKGKTSAAFWTGVRAALVGQKVAAVQWYKSPTWDVAEYKLPKYFKNFAVYPMGEGFRIKNYELRIKDKAGKTIKIASAGKGKVVDVATEMEHKKAAQEALKKAQQLLGKVDILILDEINNAVKDGLIELSELIELVSNRGRVHIILTGRGADPKIVKLADLVTEMKKVRHPFDKGKMAVKGLDY